MLQQHPITPSIELVKQWSDRWHSAKDNDFDVVLFVAIEAARWGADQQLELDAKWLDHNALNEAHLKIVPMGEVLKEAMRPKPPSLKEQAKFAAAVLRSPDETCSIAELQQHWHTICNALESLPD
jgi:hypothetical protein